MLFRVNFRPCWFIYSIQFMQYDSAGDGGKINEKLLNKNHQ
jgi:hypothetical protein